MIAVLSKPADQVGVSDLEELINSEVPESDQIEFKENLSTRGESRDRWITDGDRIGKKAKDSVLEEAVAFANAYGGALLIGIRESESSPPVAAEIKPIPRCADLAERLKLVFRDCVEPQIPSVEIFAVPTAGDCGVVVIRTGRSRMAPHRVTTTLVCPIRRSDRCEKMTMREIQDLTLNMSRGLERLERKLSIRSERFEQEIQKFGAFPTQQFGIRATGLPVGEEIRFDSVYGEDSLYEPWHQVVHINEDETEIQLNFPEPPSDWQPFLRAARTQRRSDDSYYKTRKYTYREIDCDGLVELGLFWCQAPSNPLQLPSSWPISMFANLAVWANKVRHEAASPTWEYALGLGNAYQRNVDSAIGI